MMATHRSKNNYVGYMANVNKNPEVNAAKERLLEAVPYAPSFRAACDMASVTYSTAYAWKSKDTEFAEAYAEARQLAMDRLREEAYKRAMEGYERPVLYKGQAMYRRDPVTNFLLLDDDFNPIPLTERVISDRILEKIMEANLPEHRRSRGGSVGVEVPGENDKPVKIIVNFVDPPDWDNVEWDEETGRPKLDSIDS